MLLGQTRFDGGDLAGASEAVDRTLALDPSEARAHLLRASIALARKDRAAARVSLKRCRELDPEGPSGREAAQLLSSLSKR
jgi:Flp pilus assembly protein TadD